VTEAGEQEGEDLVPVSVGLGTVVPPEDPEDWTRPLTWVAAIGMLIAPAILVGWYLLAAPTDSVRPLVGTYAVALALVVGAAAAGGTQLGRARAVTGTLAAGLLGALLMVMVGAVSGEVVSFCDCKPGVVIPPSPTLAHAAAGALAGLAGSLPAAVAEGLAAGWWSRLRRGAVAAVLGALVTAFVLPNLFPAEPRLADRSLVLGEATSALDQQAGRLVLLPDLEERRVDAAATVEGDRAARVEAAARRHP
jgi:hypothetical protein